MGSLAILGASGHGRVVADTAIEAGWRSIAFFDDASVEPSFGRWPILGDTESLCSSLKAFSGVIIGIGNNRVRLRKQKALLEAGALFPSLVHPRAYVSRDARIGAGSVVFAGAVVQPGVVLGSGVIVNTAATVDHDCMVADGAHICPGAHLAGGVGVGECAWVGIGAAVKQCVSIGSDAMVGAGAVVVSDIASGVTVVGIPAGPTTRS
jgi:sugar O-acyltransferase (sialic acid O-acetyltransferase NeuD family)